MSISIFSLGGLGEIGMNCFVLDSGREAFIIDGGIMFPDDGMVGIDYVVPDFSVLTPFKERIRGIFLTHGHDDHIGGIPYLLKDISVPVYATRLTSELLKSRLAEYDLDPEGEIRVIGRNEVVSFLDFSFEAFPVCHSIPEGVGYIVRTEDGIIVHSGDFKIDNTPPDGIRTDLKKVYQVGREGVALLLSDSTNVENQRRTLSEGYVKNVLKRIIRESKGRVIVSMFSSNIIRLSDTIETAWEEGREVAVVGMSMIQNLEIAKNLGYLKVPEGKGFVGLERIESYDESSLVILTTGSQGEPFSALSLISRGQHKYVKVKENDRVVLSSRFIPGNETAIFRLIDNLFRRGADVLYQVISEVHVSGHGGRAELSTMVKAVSPRYFVPIHGEYRHLVQHAALAKECASSESLVVEDGELLVLSNGELRREGALPLSKVYVDGKGVGDVCEMVLRERRNLSRDGVVLAVVGKDEEGGEIVYGPEIITLGVTGADYSFDIIQGARELVRESFKNGISDEEEIRKVLRRYFRKSLERKPVVFPLVIEV